MLNWARFAGFSAILAIALGGSLLWALKNPVDNAEWSCKSQINTDDEHNPDQTIIICNPAQSQKFGQDAQEVNKHDRENTADDIKITDKILALFNGLLVIVGAVQAYYLWGTVTATKIAAEHIPKVERAYIFGGPYDINVQAVPGDKLSIAIGIYVVNHGKTPGVVQKVYGEFSTTEPLGKPVYLHGESSQLYISIEGNSGPNPVYLPVRFDPPIIDYHFFFGYIEYVDIFRVVQTSRFCAKISTYEGTRQWEITGPREWNEWT